MAPPPRRTKRTPAPPDRLIAAESVPSPSPKKPKRGTNGTPKKQTKSDKNKSSGLKKSAAESAKKSADKTNKCDTDANKSTSRKKTKPAAASKKKSSTSKSISKNGNGKNNAELGTPADTSKKESAAGSKKKSATSKTATTTAQRYKGVSYHADCSKYESKILCGSSEYNLGLFDLASDAALVYDVAYRIAGSGIILEDREKIQYALDHPPKIAMEDVEAVNFTAQSQYQSARETELAEYIIGEVSHPGLDTKAVPSEEEMKFRIKKEILTLAKAYVAKEIADNKKKKKAKTKKQPIRRGDADAKDPIFHNNNIPEVMHVYNDIETYNSSETNLTHYTEVHITSRADREFPYKDRVTKQMMIDAENHPEEYQPTALLNLNNGQDRYLDVAGWPLRFNHVMLGKRGHYKKGELVIILMNNMSDYMHWDNSIKDNPKQSPRESMIALMSTQEDLVSMGVDKDKRSFTNRNINMRNNLAQMIAMSVTTNSVDQPLSLPKNMFHLDDTIPSINKALASIDRSEDVTNEIAALKTYMEACKSANVKCSSKKIAYVGFKYDYYANLSVIDSILPVVDGTMDENSVTLWTTPCSVFQRYKDWITRLTSGGVFDSYVNHTSFNKTREAGKVKKENEQKKKNGLGNNKYSGVFVNELVFLWPFVCGCSSLAGGKHTKIVFHGSAKQTFCEMLRELELNDTEYPANFETGSLIVPEPVDHDSFTS